MPIRTGKQFLEALKDDRRIFMDGEEIGDIAHDPRTAGAAQTLAELYDMQHDAALAERMVFTSSSGGGPVGLSFIEPKTVDDLIRRREMIKLWMDRTCGMFGRSPDFLNVMLTGLAAAAPEFGKTDKRFADHIRDYQVQARERDLCMTHTLLNPQVDRSRAVERQEKDLAAKIVKETGAGIVIKGARMVSTLCAYSDDLLVLPSTFLATNPDAAPYAFAFSIPVSAAGLLMLPLSWITHSPRASTRATGSRCSTTCWCRGNASSSIATRRCATASFSARARCRRSCTRPRQRIWRRPSSCWRSAARSRARRISTCICMCRGCWPS